MCIAFKVFCFVIGDRLENLKLVQIAFESVESLVRIKPEWKNNWLKFYEQIY